MSSLRQVRSYEFRCLMQYSRLELDPASSFCILRRIVSCTSYATCAIERCYLRRSNTPITAWLSGNNVKMIVGYFLTAVHTVILKRKDSQWPIRFHEGYGNSFCCDDDRGAFCFR